MFTRLINQREFLAILFTMSCTFGHPCAAHAQAAPGGSGGGNTVGDQLFDDYETSGDTPISPAEIKSIVAPVFAELDQRIPGLSTYLSRGITDITWYREPKKLDQTGMCRNGADSGLNPVLGQVVRACQNLYGVKVDANWLTETQPLNPQLVSALFVHELIVYRALRLSKTSYVDLQTQGQVQDEWHGVNDPISGQTHGTIKQPREVGDYDEEAVLLVSREIRDPSVPEVTLQRDLKKAGFGSFFTGDQLQAEISRLQGIEAMLEKSKPELASLWHNIRRLCAASRAQIGPWKWVAGQFQVSSQVDCGHAVDSYEAKVQTVRNAAEIGTSSIDEESAQASALIQQINKNLADGLFQTTGPKGKGNRGGLIVGTFTGGDDGGLFHSTQEAQGFIDTCNHASDICSSPLG